MTARAADREVVTHHHHGYVILEIDRDVLVELLVFEDGVEHLRGLDVAKVEVWKPSERFGTERGSEVLWPSIGATTPARASAVAMALLKAAEIARRLDAEQVQS